MYFKLYCVGGEATGRFCCCRFSGVSGGAVAVVAGIRRVHLLTAFVQNSKYKNPSAICPGHWRNLSFRSLFLFGIRLALTGNCCLLMRSPIALHHCRLPAKRTKMPTKIEEKFSITALSSRTLFSSEKQIMISFVLRMRHYIFSFTFSPQSSVSFPFSVSFRSLRFP